ncbi:hypothetical protein A6X21_00940 [Planctopirus hydrillae]|uniref:Uncharacterized protein n=2 Tax=Planctopirus hydrillae TaxID=1841610 RepID=A0A1C3E4X5_9PLAN|nr:hypothetical protein A6X21_00940 [Planctopirus hydrillae]
MDCHQFHTELDNLNSVHTELDHSSLSEPARKHLLDCPNCHAHWHDETQLSAAITTWKKVSTAPLQSRVCRKTPASNTATRQMTPSRFTTRWAVTAIAACLVLGVLAFRAPSSIEIVVSTFDTHRPAATSAPLWITAATLSASQFSASQFSGSSSPDQTVRFSPASQTKAGTSEFHTAAMQPSDSIPAAGSTSRPELTTYLSLSQPALHLAKLREPVEAWNSKLQQKHQGPFLETVGGLYVPVPAPPVEQWQQVAVTVAPLSQHLADAFAVLCSPFRQSEAEPVDPPGAYYVPSSTYEFSPLPASNKLFPYRNPASSLS